VFIGPASGPTSHDLGDFDCARVFAEFVAPALPPRARHEIQATEATARRRRPRDRQVESSCPCRISPGPRPMDRGGAGREAWLARRGLEARRLGPRRGQLARWRAWLLSRQLTTAFPAPLIAMLGVEHNRRVSERVDSPSGELPAPCADVQASGSGRRCRAGTERRTARSRRRDLRGRPSRSSSPCWRLRAGATGRRGRFVAGMVAGLVPGGVATALGRRASVVGGWE